MRHQCSQNMCALKTVWRNFVPRSSANTARERIRVAIERVDTMRLTTCYVFAISGEAGKHNV